MGGATVYMYTLYYIIQAVIYMDDVVPWFKINRGRKGAGKIF